MKSSASIIAVALCALIACATMPLTQATLGVDVSALIDYSLWGCMHSQGVQFAVVRCFQSVGKVDPNCDNNVYNAKANGIPYVDVYLFPCVSCGNAANQMSAMLNYLDSTNTTAKIGMVWLDVEAPKLWTSSVTTNRAFFEALANTATSRGFKVGVYTSASQWIPIMGDSYTGGSSFPLWYPHYDGTKSFADFSHFGGWVTPAIKQYYDSFSTSCGSASSFDANWYP